MIWRIQLVILIVAICSSYANEEKKKTLIIAVDELQPEESDAIISDLTIKDSSPIYQNSETAVSTRILKRAPADKKLDYILFSPEDLKDLKDLQLDGVTIDKPKILRYPDSSSDESIESQSKYTPYSRAPPVPYSVSGRNVVPKYPSRPAPPITTHPVIESSSEKSSTSHNSPYLEKDYKAYSSPDAERYKVPILRNTPKIVKINEDHSPGYRNEKSTHYRNPSSHTAPSIYANSNPSAYSGYSGYSPPGSYYGSPNLKSYSGHANYRKPTYEPYLYYGGARPFGFNAALPHYTSLPYAADKPSSYSGPSAYDIPKPVNYPNPSTYSNAKPKVYSSYTPYGNSNPNSNREPQTYEKSKPITYSGRPAYENVKPNTYTKSSGYESSKPNSFSGPSSHENSNPTVYSDIPNYDSPDHGYVKSKPDSHSNSYTYSRPSSSYSSSKPPSSYRPPSYSSPSSSHDDSSSEKIYPGPEKYISRPEKYDYPDKTRSYDEYHSSKTPSRVVEYEKDPHYIPKKSIRKGYYDSPSVKHVSYDDLPTPYKKPLHGSTYEHADSEYDEDASVDYGGSSKPASYGEYYHHSPESKYNPHPSSYEKEDKTVSYHNSRPSKPSHGDTYDDGSHKPISPYNSSPYDDSHPSRPGTSHSSKHSYDSLKTAYKSPYESSSYEEPINSHSKYRYPYSKVTYEPTTPYRDSHSTSTPLNGGSKNNAKYKSSHVYSSHDDVPPQYNSNPNSDYGRRYPISYRKTRHTDSKTPPTSHFTLEDVRSPDYEQEYRKNPEDTNTESHSHYQHYEDSSEIPNFHSVKTNYSPVRPAPVKDELYQPRYPPLPQRSKGDTTKMYYDEGEGDSRDSTENHKTEPSETETKSYNPSVYNNAYIRNSFYPPESHSSKKVNSPSSDENINHQFSKKLPEELIEPVGYGKTSKVSYTKPEKEKSSTYLYSSDKFDENAFKPYTPSRSPKRGHTLKENEFGGSQPEYLRTRHTDSYSSPAHFVHSFSYKTNENTTVPESYSSFTETYPNKRVPGVVHRSRHVYPVVKELKRQKGYLPYKKYYPKSIPAYDNKHYESMPSEVREKNTSRDMLVYDLPKKISKKSSSHAPKKYKKYSTPRSEDYSYDKNEKTNHHAIPGEPGKDYPVLKEVPYNQFSCEGKPPGFYADVENRCQVYYQCSDEGRLQSFLCPNGTIFNQLTFVCEWWHNVDCTKSEKYFGKNKQLYKLSTSSPSTSKSKRTVTDDYHHPKVENHGIYESPTYYEPENEDFSFHEDERL